MISDDKLLTFDEVAVRIGVSAKTIRRQVARGEIPCLKFGHRTVRFQWRDVVKAIQNRRIN